MKIWILSIFIISTALASHSDSGIKHVFDHEVRMLSEFEAGSDISAESIGPVILSEEALKTDRTHWFRGDKREPKSIFQDGFTARGNRTNLIEHVHGNFQDSAYISTSVFEDAASRYPKYFIGRSYIYLINPQKTGVDVNQALVVEIDAGRMLREDANFYLIDHEMAVPYKIKREHIKGAWIADSLALTQDLDSIDCIYSRKINRDSFISNPHYVKPLSKISGSIRVAGTGLLALGIYHDADCLWTAYKSGDDDRFFSESARVIGGWSGSIALGTRWGKQGSLLAWRFTKNPGIVLASGITGAVAGSVLGYAGGGLMAQEAYEGPSVWTELYQTLKRLEPDRSNPGSPAQAAHSIERDLFTKLEAFWISFKQELQETGSVGAVLKKRFPTTGPGKPDLIGVLKRLDYNSVNEPVSISSQCTAEELFGPLQQDENLASHPHSELLKHATMIDDGNAKIFKHANIENDPVDGNAWHPHRHDELEKAYSQAYELTDRVKNIRSSLMSKDAGALIPSRYYAEDLKETACIAESWALTFNSLGDRITGRKLAVIGSALSQASAGAALLSVPQASLLQTIGGFSSWISAGAVFVSLFMSDDDEGENEGMQMLMSALVQLGQALQQVLRNQEFIMDLMQATMKSIHDVDSRLRQLHSESQEAFEFIASLELQNACLALQDDLNQSNAVSMTTEDRRKALSTLERWLKQHLFSPLMTKSSSGPTTAALAVEFMSRQQDLSLNLTGFVMTQLQSHLGEAIVPSKFTQLPPLLLFTGVSHLFLQAVLKAKVDSDDACSNLLSKLQNVIDSYRELAELVQHSDQLWSSLFKQYEHQRNMVGRAMAAVKFPNQDVPLHSLITHDLKGRNLMDALDQMEEIRLFLIFLVEFAFDSSNSLILHQKVQVLESKQQILSTFASSFYKNRGSQLAYYLNQSTNDDIQLALCSGADLNLVYSGGNIFNYTGYLMIVKWYASTRQHLHQWSVDRVHLAMKHSSSNDKLNANMLSTYIPWRTWPALNYAMSMCSNMGMYGFGLLLMIAGFSQPWDKESLINSSWWAETAADTAREYQMFISSTINRDGVLNRFKLVRAFEYYRACENGEIQKANVMVQEGVDANCVLWLVALLGKWYVFERLQASVNLSQNLGKFNFGYSSFNRGFVTSELQGHGSSFAQESSYTPLMVAAEHGRIDVIEGLIREMESGYDIGITRILSFSKASSATLAFKEEHFAIAKRLSDLGAPLAENALTILSEKEYLPSGPLACMNSHPNSELLAHGDALSQGGKVIENLQNLSASMKGFSEASKWALNSKIRRLMSAIQRQAVLKHQLVQFDGIIARIESMSRDGHISGRLISQFKVQAHLLHEYFDKLQAKTKCISDIYQESYNYEAHVPEPSVCLSEEVHHVIIDESAIKAEFMSQASRLSQDFGITIEKVFELIQSAASHIQNLASFNDTGILLLGATGTGKSTLLNFLSGCLYQKTKKAGKFMRELVRGSEISETSHRSRAQTRFPVVYNHQASFSLVDLAGFLDNTENTSVGSVSSYDIAAALSMNLITKRFQSISGLIACCTQAQLTAERPPLELQETFRHIGRIIKYFPELSDNVRLFVTKHSDLEPADVIEGLQELAIDFSSDEDMCTFLNLFVTAVDRVIFTDVINDEMRGHLFSELEKLKPQETYKFNFGSHSTAFTRLQELVKRIVSLRNELRDKIELLEIEKEDIFDIDMNDMLCEHIPHIRTNIQDDHSIDSLIQEQNGLSECFSQITQVSGLLDLVQGLELKILRLNEIVHSVQLLKAKERIEAHFISDCHNLGLCDLID